MKTRYQIGQSLFEIVVAIGVTAIIIVSLISLSTSSVKNATFSNSQVEASRYSQAAVEWLRAERDENWEDFRGHADDSLTYCLRTLSSSVWTDTSNWGGCSANETIGTTIFRREVTFSCFLGGVPSATPTPLTCNESAVDTIHIRFSTRWQDSQGTHEAEAGKYLTDWRSW